MPRKRICVLNCPEGNQKIFQFPDEIHQKPRRELWMRQLKVKNQAPKLMYACERHFSDAMLRSARKYPDQNLDVQTNPEKSSTDSNSITISLPTLLSSPSQPPVSNLNKASTMTAKNSTKFDIERHKCDGNSQEINWSKKSSELQTAICCVSKCSGKERSYFSFPDPERQPERRQEWLRRLGISGSQPRLLYACDRHFSESMRVRSNLRLEAVPDQNICIDTNNEAQPITPVIPPPNCDHDYIRWPYKATEVSFLPVKPVSNNNDLNINATKTTTMTPTTVSTKLFKSSAQMPIVPIVPIRLPLVCLPEHKKLDEKEVAIYTRASAAATNPTKVCTSDDLECDIVPYTIRINKDKPAQQLSENRKQAQANLTDLRCLPILQKPHTLTTFSNDVKGIAIPVETTQLQPNDPLSIDIRIDPSFLNGVNADVAPKPIAAAQKTCDPLTIDIRIDPIFANEIKGVPEISSSGERTATNKTPAIEYYGIDSLPILPSFADYKKAKYVSVVGRFVQTDKFLLDRMPDRKKMIDELTELRRKVKDQAKEIKRITLENELLHTQLDVIKTKNAERNLFY